ncbi:hypothetical protein JCM21900_006371 [Sporobolomyces salmonicolor]
MPALGMPTRSLSAPEARSSAEQRVHFLLVEARLLGASLPPLFTWPQLCELIASCKLAALKRHPQLEALYTGQFNPAVKLAYGSTEAYLRKQLGWGPDQQKQGQYWERTGDTRVRLNDWGYAVPRDVIHYVVWVPLPLFHPLLCSPPATPASTASLPTSLSSSPTGSLLASPSPTAQPLPNPLLTSAPTKTTWDFICRNGLSGLTGEAARTRRIEEGRQEEDEDPGREIAAFVRETWKAEDGWETAW